MTLAARALGFGFRDRLVGRGFEGHFDGREITCLLGPNGSGKTTLLRTLLGVLPAREGEVRLDDQPLASFTARHRARRIAYVPQAAESYFEFTVRELVEMGRTAHGGLFAQPGRADREAAERSLDRLGIASLAGRPLDRLSGGERQLALIARALASEAPTLVMDEPTANLDFANQSRVLDEIAKLRDGGCTILFTTHHPDHALRIADRAILLRAGAAIANGATGVAVDSANLSALYGRPVEVVDVALPGAGVARVCLAMGCARFD